MLTRSPNHDHRPEVDDIEREHERDLADERTRRLPPVEERDDETVVNVNQPPVYTRERPATEVVHRVPASVLAVRKAQQVIWYFFGVLETLLALRFILFAIGANPANAFFGFLRTITDAFVWPFSNLVETPRVAGVATLEFGTIVAMLIYLLLAIAITKLLDLAITRSYP